MYFKTIYLLKISHYFIKEVKFTSQQFTNCCAPGLCERYTATPTKQHEANQCRQVAKCHACTPTRRVCCNLSVNKSSIWSSVMRKKLKHHQTFVLKIKSLPEGMKRHCRLLNTARITTYYIFNVCITGDIFNENVPIVLSLLLLLLLLVYIISLKEYYV